MNYTDMQYKAVNITDGNYSVCSSAGSGKTFVFVHRIKHLIDNGVQPFNILAITFTNKAADEMRERLVGLIGEQQAAMIYMSTIHSVFYRCLKTHYNEEFKMLKIAPDWQLSRWAWDLAGERTKYNDIGLDLPMNGSDFLAMIAHHKSKGLTHDDYQPTDYEEEEFQNAWSQFEKMKANARLIDFNDILLMMYQRLKNDKVFREKCGSQFHYIMMDEAQDSSEITMKCIKLINDKNFYIVFDFRQAIYGFNGGNIDNVLNFDEMFNNATLIEMNSNFRSTQNIVELSNAVIDTSPLLKYKKYQPAKSIAEDGKPVEFNMYYSDKTQIADIARRISIMVSEGASYSDIAILVRTNLATQPIEEELTNMDIPHVVSKSRSFFDRKEILDLLSYLRLATNPADNESFRRIYNTPNRYLSNKSLEALGEYANANDMSLYDALKSGEVKTNADWSANKLIKTIDYLRKIVGFKSPDKVLKAIIDEVDYYKHNGSSGTAEQQEEREKAIARLIDTASKFDKCSQLLGFISNIKNQQEKSKDKDCVQIVTCHSSKGLEFERVFVVNMVDDVFPHKMAKAQDNIEEERRLFYVAVSRAKKELYISWYAYEETENSIKEVQVSEFIEELLGFGAVKELRRILNRRDGKHSSYDWSIENEIY